MEADLIVLKRFIEKHSLQAAQHLEALVDAETSAFLEEIPVELAVHLINSMTAYKAANCLVLLRPSLAVSLLEKTEADVAVSLLRQVDPAFRNDWLSRVSPDRSALLQQKLSYDPGSVGAFMIPLTVVLRQDTVVEDAIRIVKNNRDEISTSVFIVDQQDRLLGRIPLHELFLATNTEQISTIMERETPKFFADMQVASIKDHPGWHTYRSIPVVDNSEKLIGLLNFDATLKNVNPAEDMSMHVKETSNALGELFRLGLTGFLQTLGEVK